MMNYQFSFFWLASQEEKLRAVSREPLAGKIQADDLEYKPGRSPHTGFLPAHSP